MRLRELPTEDEFVPETQHGIFSTCDAGVAEGLQNKGCPTRCPSVRLWYVLPLVAEVAASQACSLNHTEHLRFLLAGPVDTLTTTVSHYKQCIRSIADSNLVVPQTSKTADGQALTTITPNYLCLQCSTTTTAAGRIEHGRETKHRFCMLSIFPGLTFKS